MHLEDADDNKANGYRPGRAYGHGKLLELRIPRDRNGEFYPKVLALLRSQQAETDKPVSALYGQGLTQAQVGDVFERLYGRHYSPHKKTARHTKGESTLISYEYCL